MFCGKIRRQRQRDGEEGGGRGEGEEKGGRKEAKEKKGLGSCAFTWHCLVCDLDIDLPFETDFLSCEMTAEFDCNPFYRQILLIE